jgi:transposase
VFASLFLAFSLAAAPTAKIENLAATAANGKVSVRFSLAGAFANGEMIEALQSGLPTSFTYVVEIFRDRPNWFDDGLARARIEVICTFNSVTREYLLNYRRDDRLVRSETFTDLAALERSMTTVEEMDLFDIGGRKPYKLKVRAKADLMRGWLMYVIPWEVSTRWRETRVRVAEKQSAVGSRPSAGAKPQQGTHRRPSTRNVP